MSLRRNKLIIKMKYEPTDIAHVLICDIISKCIFYQVNQPRILKFPNRIFLFSDIQAQVEEDLYGC